MPTYRIHQSNEEKNMQTKNVYDHDLALDSSGGNPITWVVFAVFSVLVFGLGYPAITTLLGQTIFPHKLEVR
jgi:hypothetical protein